MIRHGQNRPNKGFTAVEIAMVASVIAILALLILPVFRQRAEEARKVAAQDELASLAKALLLVEADLPGGGFLPRLNDLDNRENTLKVATDPDVPDLDPPRFRWGFDTGTSTYRFIQLSDPEYFNSVTKNFKGPYVAQKNTVSLGTINGAFPLLTDSTGNQGPIHVDAIDDLVLDRYPVDPWGTPYMLFGPEETVYNVRVIYSLGPNGVPGNQINPVAGDYNRRNNVLGAAGTDDYFFIF